MEVRITPHARERFVERGGRIMQRLAEVAYQQGAQLTKHEQQVMFDKGIFKDNFWGSEYRKHLGLIWVFRRNRGYLILVTVLHTHFMVSPLANFKP